VGKNIQKFRLIRDKSQMDIAVELEEKRHKPVSQQLISDIENRETIEDEELLQQIAEILKVDAETLKTLDWDAAINIIGNTFHDHAFQSIYSTIHQTINPLDKLIELFEKDKAELKAEIAKLKKGKK
jgi:transcriptional regulator with XRE-family HTH domain